ncbi:MAG: hypothetical protein WCA77_03085 [Thermoplasmata archaeon]
MWNDDPRVMDLSAETLESPFLPPWEPVDEVREDRTVRSPRSVLRIPRRRPSTTGSGRILPEDPPLFDWLSHRFHAGEATLWVGTSRALDELLEMLYAASAGVGGRISLLESANRFQPYRVGERARGLGIDPGEALARIRLARAFTAYQLVALVDAWAREVRRTHPTLLVAHGLADLLASEEVPEVERLPLFHHVADTLHELVRSEGRPLLLTCPRGFDEFPGLREHGPTLFDLVQCVAYPHHWALDGFRDGSRLMLVDRTPGQLGLEQFLPHEPTEVLQWAARSPRTARRSKSG